MVAVDIGVMEVGRRRVEAEGGFAKLGPVPREVDRDHREGAAGARLQLDGGEGGGAAPGRIVRDHRPLGGIAQSRLPWRPVLDRDRDFDALERTPPLAVAVPLRIVGVKLKDEQVLLVDMEIGSAEGEAIGVALHDPRQARGAAADHVEPGSGQMGDVARIEAADAKMRIVGQDRPARRAAPRADGPGVASGVRGRRGRSLGSRDQRVPRKAAQAQHPQIGLGHCGGVEPFGHGEVPRRLQRSDHRVQPEQPHGGEPRAPHLGLDAERAAACQHHVAHVPPERAHAQDGIFEGQQRRIGHNLVDPGVDPRRISAGAGDEMCRHRSQLRVQVAAKEEQPRRGVMGGELGPERLRQPPELAPVREVELEQAVARDGIALAEKGVGDRSGADMGDAVGVVDDLDRRRQARGRHLARARDGRRGGELAGRQKCNRRGRAEQE